MPPAERRVIPRRPEPDLAPLSFAQKRLWFLAQLEPGSPAYNRPVALYLRGPLDLTALEDVLGEILRRHEVLRATFPTVEGWPLQVIAPTQSLTLSVVDLSHVPLTTREFQVRRLVCQEALRPFDLAQGPLMIATLLRLDGEEHVLLLVMHQIVFDGWSARILIRELTTLYEAFSTGRSSPLPELPIQYADFAHWQRGWLHGQVLERQLSYWREKLASAPPTLDLPADRPRPPVQTFRGACQSLLLPSPLLHSLKVLSRQEGVTLFMTLLAAFKTLLHRYTGQDDLVVGSPIAGRTHVEMEGLIGFFVNTLVLRTDLAGDPTFRDLLGRVRQVALEAYAHQDLPFEKLVEELRPERDLSRTPLFQVMFNLENLPEKPLPIRGLRVDEFEFETGIARFDLNLEIVEKAEGLSCLFKYNADLFDPATVARMLGHLRVLLEGIVADPGVRLSALPLLTAFERRRLLGEWNDTQADYPADSCIHQLFEVQARRTPDAIAVEFEGQLLTYGQLDARANGLARHLRKFGVGPEVLVGICVERSLEMVVGLLGILKAGGAYVALDPAYPQERLAFMLEDAQVSILLTQERLLSRMPPYVGRVLCLDGHGTLFGGEERASPEAVTRPDQLAYVVYTSGSTGRPKGVLIRHRGVVNYLTYLAKTFHLNRADVVLQIPSFSFDASVRDMIGPLTVGARVVLVPEADAREPSPLLSKVKEHRVTCLLSVVPTMLRGLTEAACQEARPYYSVRLIAASGEVLHLTDCVKARRAFGDGTLIVNQYGPTEATMTTTHYPVAVPQNEEGTALIGRPIPNAQVYILDRHLNHVPVGVPGELHIGGVGLARGYLNRPGLTAEKFVTVCLGDGSVVRLYRTGDLACYRSSGDIEFLGRADRQVKIRGFRVELGEIEAVLGGHPALRAVAVLAREDERGDKRLVAYCVPDPGQAPATGELRGFLAEKLPACMIPSAFVTLEALPLTASGKLDRRALPVPDQARPDLEAGYVAPRDALERQLVAVWEEVLGVRPIGTKDNFFGLGGHSLLAVRLLAQIGKVCGQKLPLATLFQRSTVEQIAKVLRQADPSPPPLSLVAIQPGGSRPPFFEAALLLRAW
jgi:aspartate racemase